MVDWIKVEKLLPRIGINVVAFGFYEWDEEDPGGNLIHYKEPITERGFRSSVDDAHKPNEWADFSFIVTHWFYLEFGPCGEVLSG